jgi:flagellar protein FlaG
MELSPIASYTADLTQRQTVSVAVQSPPIQASIVTQASAASSQTGNQGSSQEKQQQQTQAAVEPINKTMASMSRNLEFTVDDDVHMTIVKVVDTQTNDVIRQIPSQEVVEIARALDKIQGLLIKQHV